MTKTIQTILTAAIVFGSASVVLADDGTDATQDTSRNGATITHGLQFKSSKAGLPMNQIIYSFDQAGANHDNGGN